MLGQGTTLTLPASGSDASGLSPSTPIEVHVQSELMEHYEAGAHVACRRRLQVVHAAGQQSAVLFAGHDDALYLAQRNNRKDKGWRIESLTAAFGEGVKVDSFSVINRPDDKTQVALAISRPSDPGSSEIHETAWLRLDEPDKTEWRPRGKQPGVRMVESTYGRVTFDGRTHQDVLVAVGSDGNLYRIHLGEGSPKIEMMGGGGAAPAFGYRSSSGRTEPGVWVLGDKRFVFILLRTHTAIVNPDWDPSAMADDSTFSTPTRFYYTEGNRLLLAIGDETQDLARLSSRGQPEERCDQLILTERSGYKALYLRTKSGKLMISILQSIGPDGEKWSPPRRLRGDVAGLDGGYVAPVSGHRHELFLASDGHLIHLWQDRRSTRWISSEVLLPSVDKIHHVMTSTTRIQLRTANHEGLHNHKVRLRATEAVWLTVNGEAFFLDTGEQRELITDGHGSLTVIGHLSSLAIPRFQIETDLFEQAVNIDPVAHLQKKLRHAASTNLNQVMIGEGHRREKLLKGRFERNAAEGAKALEKFAEGLDRWQLGGVATPGVSLAAPNQPFTSELGPEGRTQDYCWSLELQNGVAVYRDAAATRQELLTPEFDRIVRVAAGNRSWLGTLLEHILHGADDILTLVFNGASVFIRTVEGVIEFVAELAEQFLHIIKVSLKMFLGIDLDMAIKWLGFIFNWEDILATHNVMVRTADQTLTDARGKLEAFKEQLSTYLDELAHKVDQLEIPKPLQGKNHQVLSDEHARHGGAGEAHQEVVQKHRDTLDNHPTMAWAGHQMTHGQPAGHPPPEALLGDLDAERKQNLLRFFNKVHAHGSSVTAGFKTHHQTMKTLFESEEVKLEEVLSQFVHDLLRVGVEVVKEIATEFVGVVEDLITVVDHLLQREIQIPFLTALYKTVIHGGGTLTPINAMLLVAAIPATIFSKALQKKPPFQGLENKSLADPAFKQAWTVWAAGVGGATLQSLRFGLRFVKSFVDLSWLGYLAMFGQMVFLLLVFPALQVSDYAPELTVLWLIWSTFVADLLCSLGLLQLRLGKEVHQAISAVLAGLAGLVLHIEEMALLVARLTDPKIKPIGIGLAIATALQLGILTQVARLTNKALPLVKEAPQVWEAFMLVWLATDVSARVIHAARATVAVLLDVGVIKDKTGLSGSLPVFSPQ